MERRFNGGFFALPVWGAYNWRGLYMEGLIFGILRYFPFCCASCAFQLCRESVFRSELSVFIYIKLTFESHSCYTHIMHFACTSPPTLPLFIPQLPKSKINAYLRFSILPRYFDHPTFFGRSGVRTIGNAKVGSLKKNYL